MTPNYYYAERLWQFRQAEVEKVNRNAWMRQAIPREHGKHSRSHPLLLMSRILNNQES